METASNAGALVLVATPLGNLGDITRRAIDVLERADTVYCEDTRRTRVLLSALGIPGRGRLVALHAHNEADLGPRVIDEVASGRLVALVSDAGTPGVSDPGARVAGAVAEAGLVVSTAPGPSAVLGALSVSGLDSARFVMDGFVPRRSGERAEWFEQWAQETRTIVAFESPQRVGVTLGELAERFPTRRAALVRELTKLHEEVRRGTLRELADAVAGREVRGEVVLVIEGATPRAPDGSVLRAALEERLDAGLSVRDAVAEVASELGVAHREAYELALSLRSGTTR